MDKPKVLVLDDSMNIVENLAEWLELNGFEPIPMVVYPSTDLAELDAVLRQNIIYAVITDQNMFLFSGLSVIDLALRRGVSANRVILCSTDDSGRLENAVVTRGAIFVAKPVSFASILQALRAA